MYDKPLLLFQAPVATRSGYGDHSRDLLKSLRDMDKFDIKIVPTRWGTTPQNQISINTEFGRWIVDNIITTLDRQPDVFVQVTVANEFNPIGKFNIGVTAGVETTAVPIQFLEGCNRMDLIIVPSNFTKQVIEQTSYQKKNQHTGQLEAVVKLERPVEVLFEGLNLDVFGKVDNAELSVLDHVETEFNFLFVGHWLQGDIGEDRKDVGMMLKTFVTTFKDLPKNQQPGIIVKTSMAGFSIIERDNIAKRIKDIVTLAGDNCPPIYFLYGDMTEGELNNLYNHPKVKAMISFTKGEGYGRPLQEFAITGKPILVSAWSGHMDFLPEDYVIYLDGELNNVHPSAVNDFILREAKWFTVNYTHAAQKMYKLYKGNYAEYLKNSAPLSKYTEQNFSLEKMTEKFTELMDKYVKVAKKVTLDLPEITRL